MNSGLREQKKRETRAAISRIATELFFKKGFDAVTVDDVARAAKVSKMTVFNYFARKEDLLFDRELEGIEHLRSVLEGCAAESLLAVLREEVTRLVADGYVFTKFDAEVVEFWKVIEASPVLLGRLRELADEARALLAVHFEGGHADLVASLLVAGWRAAYRVGLNAAKQGRSASKSAAEFERVLDVSLVAVRSAMRASGPPRRARRRSIDRAAISAHVKREARAGRG